MKIRYMAVLMLSLCALAQTTPKGASPEAQAIASRAFVGGHSMDYLTEMTDKFGPRLLSSDNHMNAAKWAADQFRAMGIKDVRLESFTIPHSWKRVAATGRILTPVERPLHLESLGWSPATPDGGVKGEVVLLDEFSADAIKQRASEINGKVVLLNMKK